MPVFVFVFVSPQVLFNVELPSQCSLFNNYYFLVNVAVKCHN